MAIHPLLPGLVLTIDVAGQDLPEYNEEEQDDANPRECVKYVEAVSGAEFGFGIRFDAGTFPHANEAISLECFLDGQGVGESWFDAQSRRIHEREIQRGAITATRQGLVSRPMLFAELTISDDAPDRSLIGKLSKLGTITIHCHLAHLRPTQSKRPRHRNAKTKFKSPFSFSPAEVTDNFTPLLANGQIPEKNLKGMALSHQAVEPTSLVHKGPPIATFIFKYRSRGALQALHVIPRTPSPVPLEERPVEELSMEDMRELVRRQKAALELQNEHGTKHGIKKEIKRERDLPSSEGEESDVEVVEHRNKRIRADRGHGNAGPVIDLCDD
ncbi:hypothetical protein LTS10_000754 [Elasticomyces elasticus]|nr:hypothetical protein LTS10_000754 [Elasticomyces elasticus]